MSLESMIAKEFIEISESFFSYLLDIKDIVADVATNEINRAVREKIKSLWQSIFSDPEHGSAAREAAARISKDSNATEERRRLRQSLERLFETNADLASKIERLMSEHRSLTKTNLAHTARGISVARDLVAPGAHIVIADTYTYIGNQNDSPPNRRGDENPQGTLDSCSSKMQSMHTNEERQDRFEILRSRIAEECAHFQSLTGTRRSMAKNYFQRALISMSASASAGSMPAGPASPFEHLATPGEDTEPVRAAILGGPGSGKSTYLRSIAWATASNLREEGRLAPILLDTWRIFGTSRPTGLADLPLGRLLGELCATGANNLREQDIDLWAAQGQLLILWDGAELLADSPSLLHELPRVLERFERCHVIFSCRTASFNSIDSFVKVKKILRLAPLEPAQLESYISRACPDTIVPLADDPKDFLHLSSASPNRSLGTPLMIEALCEGLEPAPTYNGMRRAIPRSQARILLRAFCRMMSRANAPVNHQNRRADYLPLIERVLSQICLYISLRGQSNTISYNLISDFFDDEINKTLPEARGESSSLIQDAVQNVGIIYRGDDFSFRFFHDSFFDLLAAISLATSLEKHGWTHRPLSRSNARIDVREAISQLYSDPSHNNALVLLAGLVDEKEAEELLLYLSSQEHEKQQLYLLQDAARQLNAPPLVALTLLLSETPVAAAGLPDGASRHSVKLDAPDSPAASLLRAHFETNEKSAEASLAAFDEATADCRDELLELYDTVLSADIRLFESQGDRFDSFLVYCALRHLDLLADGPCSNASRTAIDLIRRWRDAGDPTPHQMLTIRATRIPIEPNHGQGTNACRRWINIGGYEIGKYPVTIAEYGRFSPASAKRLEACGADPRCPMVATSWYEAWSYAFWTASRLPREKEWEFAARGPELRSYPWGNSSSLEIMSLCANFRDSGINVPSPVGSFPEGVSWAGAEDMAGNTWEWCSDSLIIGSSPEQSSASSRCFSSQRILKGGCWTSPKGDLRTTARISAPPTTRAEWYGFRIAHSVESD